MKKRRNIGKRGDFKKKKKKNIVSKQMRTNIYFIYLFFKILWVIRGKDNKNWATIPSMFGDILEFFNDSKTVMKRSLKSLKI